MFGPVFGVGLLLSEPRGSDVWGIYAIGSGFNRNKETLWLRGGRRYIRKKGNVNNKYLHGTVLEFINAGNKPENNHN